MSRIEKEGAAYSMPQDDLHALMHIYRALLLQAKPIVKWVSGTYTGGYCSGFECKEWYVYCDLPPEYWNDYVYEAIQFDWDGMELPTEDVEVKEYINGKKTAKISAGCCLYDNMGGSVLTKFKFVATLVPVPSAELHRDLMQRAMQDLEKRLAQRDKS